MTQKMGLNGKFVSCVRDIHWGRNSGPRARSDRGPGNGSKYAKILLFHIKIRVFEYHFLNACGKKTFKIKRIFDV